jgi:hypothetical protein
MTIRTALLLSVFLFSGLGRAGDSNTRFIPKLSCTPDAKQTPPALPESCKNMKMIPHSDVTLEEIRKSVELGQMDKGVLKVYQTEISPVLHDGPGLLVSSEPEMITTMKVTVRDAEKRISEFSDTSVGIGMTYVVDQSVIEEPKMRQFFPSFDAELEKTMPAEIKKCLRTISVTASCNPF